MHKTTARQAVPLAGEALQDAGDLLAHDLKLGHARVSVHLLHHLHATCPHDAQAIDPSLRCASHTLP